mmetsp:Transcript_42529/g.76334  ORF Transcript_42529/g.76334 Transcript_42529/m.76334 type:complete len:342 (+) Transcript_42529:2536-3561(+)
MPLTARTGVTGTALMNVMKVGPGMPMRETLVPSERRGVARTGRWSGIRGKIKRRIRTGISTGIRRRIKTRTRTGMRRGRRKRIRKGIRTGIRRGTRRGIGTGRGTGKRIGTRRKRNARRRAETVISARTETMAATTSPWSVTAARIAKRAGNEMRRSIRSGARTGRSGAGATKSAAKRQTAGWRYVLPVRRAMRTPAPAEGVATGAGTGAPAGVGARCRTGTAALHAGHDPPARHYRGRKPSTEFRQSPDAQCPPSHQRQGLHYARVVAVGAAAAAQGVEAAVAQALGHAAPPIPATGGSDPMQLVPSEVVGVVARCRTQTLAAQGVAMAPSGRWPPPTRT